MSKSPSFLIRIKTDFISDYTLRLGNKLEDATLGVVCQEIDRAVGTLPYVTESLAVRSQVLQQALLTSNLFTFHCQSHEVRAAETTDKEAVLPRGKQLARIEDHTARRDVRIPVVTRLLHAFLLLDAAGDGRALILDAVRDRRPAVVLALARDVALVPAARAVPDFPQFTCRRIQRSRLHVAMAERPDLGPHAFFPDERIVLG